MLIEQIQSDLKTALKEKDELRISTLRLLLAEIHNKKIEKQKELNEEEVIGVLKKAVKNRQESIEAYQKGGRQELVEKERKEMDILSKYLPQEMPIQELEKIVQEVISEIKPQGAADFGRVMGVVMGRVKGRIDGAKVAEVVKRMI